MERYVVITPAHNEAAFIAKTAESIIAQTVKPLRWVVVDDASTDRTKDIIASYQKDCAFIDLIQVTRPPGRHFGNKVGAFNAGWATVIGTDFEFVGNIDADTSFGPDYFEALLARFRSEPNLGVAGGIIHTSIDGAFLQQKIALDSVAGAVQLFRRECFSQIGGYHALPNGGIDAAAEISSRMHGFASRTFPELVVREHRLTGSATSSPLGARVKEGKRMHSLGYCPWFFAFRCFHRILERPAFVGSMAALLGYFFHATVRKSVAVSPEMVRFLRKEQRQKLRNLWRTKIGGNK